MKLSESISVNDYTKKYSIEGDTCDIGKQHSRTLNNKSGLITIEELEFNEREMDSDNFTYFTLNTNIIISIIFNSKAIQIITWWD